MTTSNKMNIPATISVGYQERQDTYTGKLAYVIYTDAKGVLRKEKSWDSWRDKKIKPTEHTNEPLSGFVLNKGVGGSRASYGWNARNEYIRVYDPRGFEFEISVANLLFILQESTSTKGKGLEGEFVYAWDGTELVLLPVCSNEYTACVKFTGHQTDKVTQKEMVEGCSYLMKDMRKVMYLGRHDWYDPKNDYQGNYSIEHKGKTHVFLILDMQDNKTVYLTQNGFTKLATKLSDVLPGYADAYDIFKKSIHASPAKEVKISKRKITKKELTDYWYQLSVLIKQDTDYKVADISHVRSYKNNENVVTYEIETRPGTFIPNLKDGTCSLPQRENNYHYYGRENKNKKVITEEELLNNQFYTVSIENEKGVLYNLLNS